MNVKLMTNVSNEHREACQLHSSFTENRRSEKKNATYLVGTSTQIEQNLRIYIANQSVM